MKKLATGIFAATLALAGMTAFAAEDTQDVYVGSDNSVHITENNNVTMSDYETVIIRKKGTTADSDVVYVDQNSNKFSNVTDFMLKAGTAKGDYTATFGNSAGTTKSFDFVVGDISATNGNESATIDNSYKMTVVDEAVADTQNSTDTEKKWKKGFTFSATATELDGYNFVYLVSADGKTLYGGFSLDLGSTDGDGNMAFGIQIYNIPEANKDMNLYFAKREASK